MIAVIFEVELSADAQTRYLSLAAELKPLLQEMDGFISIERFASLNQPGKLLSLSFWRDEAAVQQWRQLAQHCSAQQLGRTGIFADYRLRVAAVKRDYGLLDRGQAPVDSLVYHQP